MPTVDISIRRKRHVTRPKGSKRGPLDIHREPDYLKRRIKPEGFINFYDLGQIKDGDDWLDIPFSSTPIPDGEGIVLFNTLEQWQPLMDLIFAYDPSTWKTQFRKLGYEDAERYGVDLHDDDIGHYYPVARNGSRYIPGTTDLVSDTKWTSQGLKLTDALSAFTISSDGAFVGIFNNSSLFKITTSPSFAASPVSSFTLAKAADVFLAPRVVGRLGTSSTTPIVNLSGDVGTEWVFGAYAPLQRAFWLDKNYVSGFPALSYDLPETLSPSDMTAYLANVKAGGYSFYTNSYDVSGFPSLGPYQSAFFSIQFQVGVRLDVGVFCGAVLQGGVMYYFWANDVGFHPPDESDKQGLLP